MLIRTESRFLFSFHYFRDQALGALLARNFAPPLPDVFADSGGFSAKTQGLTIDPVAYAGWLKHNAKYITAYANLDLIGDAEGTLANQRLLEGLGLRPVPVFHVGEPFGYLEDYLASYEYVALGGMVPYLHPRRNQALYPWLVRCFKMAQGRARYHGFGATTWEIIRSFPWRSIDSTYWTRGVRYGDCWVFDARRGRFAKFQLGHRKSVYRVAPLIEAAGYDPADFAHRGRNDRGIVAAISADSCAAAERWVAAYYGREFRFYLAAGFHDVRMLRRTADGTKQYIKGQR
jgi:hypothetical protein